MKDNGIPTRVSNDYACLVREIQVDFARKGKPVPSAKEISKMIARQIKEKGLLYDEFISFK